MMMALRRSIAARPLSAAFQFHRSQVRYPMTNATLFGRRRKGTEREEADRKKFLLLSRYWTLNPEGLQREEVALFNIEPRVQIDELIKRYLDEGRVAQLFQIWKEEQGKVYEDPEEDKQRLLYFERRSKSILKRNPEAGYTLGLNRFAANSPEEDRKLLSGGKVCGRKANRRIRQIIESKVKGRSGLEILDPAEEEEEEEDSFVMTYRFTKNSEKLKAKTKWAGGN